MKKFLLALVVLAVFVSPAQAISEKCIGPKVLTAAVPSGLIHNFFNEFDSAFTITYTVAGTVSALFSVANEGDTTFYTPLNRQGGTPVAITATGFLQFDGPWSRVKMVLTTCTACTFTYNICAKGY